MSRARNPWALLRALARSGPGRVREISACRSGKCQLAIRDWRTADAVAHPGTAAVTRYATAIPAAAITPTTKIGLVHLPSTAGGPDEWRTLIPRASITA